MTASNLAIALAHELGSHIDDLVDTGETALSMPDAGGERAGVVLDTMQDGDADNSFIVVVADGRRVRVTCEELPPAPPPPNSFLAWMQNSETKPMTDAERKAFEQRTDFPGWDAL